MVKMKLYAAAILAVALLLATPVAGADGGTKAAGLPLLTPTQGAFAGNRTYYYELPNDPGASMLMSTCCPSLVGTCCFCLQGVTSPLPPASQQLMLPRVWQHVCPAASK
jgi:hypothetical protein